MMKLDTFLGGLLNSKRFWVALITLIVYIVGLQVPVVASHADQFGSILSTVALVVIGGYSIEQTAAAWKGKPDTPQAALVDLLSELIASVQQTPAPTSATSGGAVASPVPPVSTAAQG